MSSVLFLCPGESARAIIAQFVANGVLTYGPRVVFTGMGAESE